MSGITLNQSLGHSLTPDVTIIVETETFQVHREILKAGSAYFKGMFNVEHGFKESSASTVHLDDEPLVVAALVGFLYTGAYTVPTGASEMLWHAKMYSAGTYYQVATLQKIAEDLFVNAAGLFEVSGDQNITNNATSFAHCVAEVYKKTPRGHGPLRSSLVKIASRKLTLLMHSSTFELVMEEFGEFSKDIAIAAIAIMAENKKNFGGRIFYCRSCTNSYPMPDHEPVECRACHRKLANSPLA